MENDDVMNRQIFVGILLFVIFFLVQPFVLGEENCQVARPWFGSINCEEGEWSQPIEVGDGEIWSCDVESCQIEKISINDLDCGLPATRRLTVKDENDVKIIDCDATVNSLSSECQENFPKTLTKGNKIKTNFECDALIKQWNPKNNPKLIVKYRILRLELNVDSGHGFIPSTEDCKFDEIWNNHYSPQGGLSGNTFNPLLSTTPKTNSINDILNVNLGGENFKPAPVGTYVSQSKPNKMNYRESKWIVYDWVTRPDLIVNDYNGKKVWCSPIDHSLVEFSKIETNANNCYLIPTNRLSEKAVCCGTDECKIIFNEQNIYCTDDFKCGFEKSCSSDFDCGSTESTCQESSGKYYLVSSYCDKSKTDSYGKGQCKSRKEEVKCCNGNDGGPYTCGSGKFCDYQMGCRTVLLECPAGSCCRAGEKYIEKSCPVGEKCCIESGFVGECKTSCDPPPQKTPVSTENSNKKSSESITTASGNNIPTGQTIMGQSLLPILGIVVALLIGVALVFIFVLKPSKKDKDLDSELGKGEEEF